MRIALMTDLSSVALSSRSGLVVSTSSPGARDDRRTSSGSIRIELREPSRLPPSRSPVYRISVATTDDPRRARKLAEELTKKFDEQAAPAYDSKEKEYAVVIGRFTAKSDANPLLARVRRSGYAEARIVVETNADESLSKDSKPAKSKSQSDRQTEEHRYDKSDRKIRISALDADKLIAASEERLIVFPAQNQTDRFDGSGVAANDSDENESDERRESSLGATAAPLAVRLGDKQYRGEIHLIMNRRGRINVINAVSMEDYLAGVVPMELSPGQYPSIEALKAQAIAARTYALANRNQHAEDGFDLYDDARSQVMGG